MKVLQIAPATAKHKKYKALVEIDGKLRWISFGDTRYEQYRDQTPLKLYSYLDHGNKQRREAYLRRHQHDYRPAGILAREFLW
jgi:Family of unknown function (DUF5754)